MESLSPRKETQLRFIPETLVQLADLSKHELFELAVHILHVPLEKRNQIQEEALRRALRDIDFFKRLIIENDEELFEKCIHRIHHVSFLKDEIVCSIGDPGLCFYVLLKGQVSVSVNVQKGGESLSHKSKDRKLNSHKNFQMQEVNVLKGGSYFGELALLNGGLRTATVKCIEDTDFAVLTRADFKEVLGKHTRQKIEQNMQFFESLPIFDKSSRRAISTMLYHFKLLRLPKNYMIYRQGEEATHLYIIKSGEVKISKSVFVPKETSAFTKEDELRPPKPNKINSELAILGTKEILGAEELYKNIRRESSAVVLSPEAEIFAMNKKDFDVRLSETDEFLTYFKNYCKKTLALRDNLVRLMIDTVGHSPVRNWTLAQKSNLSKSKDSSPKKRNLRHLAAQKKVLTDPNPGILEPRITKMEPHRIITEASSKIASEPAERTDSFLRRRTENTDYSPSPSPSPSTSLNQRRPQRLNTVDKEFHIEVGSLSPLKVPTTRNKSNPPRKLETSNQNCPPTQLILTPMDYSTPSRSRNSQPASNRQSSLHTKAGMNRLEHSNRTILGTKSGNQATILNQKATIKPSSKDPKKRNDTNGGRLPPSLTLDEAGGLLDNFNRSYFTTKRRPPRREMDYHVSRIEAQKRILDERLRDLPPQEDPPRVNFLDNTPSRRTKKANTPTSMAIPKKNLTVKERYKNLYFFNTNSKKELRDPYEVNNIHLQARNTIRTSQSSRSRSFSRVMTENNDSSLIVSKIKNESSIAVGTHDRVSTTLRQNDSEFIGKYQDRPYLGLDLSEKNINLQKARNQITQLTSSTPKDSEGMTIKAYI